MSGNSLIPGATQILSDNAVGKALNSIDIEDVISSFGIGIAKSQAALDNNSIQQLIALKDGDPALKGKSLLELGFAPSFYTFSTATLNFGMEMQMTVKQDIGFDLDVDSDVDKTVNKTSVSGKKRVRHGEKDFGFNLHKTRTHSTDNMNFIYDLSRNNKETDDYLMLGDKVAVSTFANTTNSANSRLTINEEEDIIIVPPVGGVKWSIFKIDSALTASSTKTFKVMTVGVGGASGDCVVNAATSDKSMQEVAEDLEAWAKNNGLEAMVFGFRNGVDEKVYFEFDDHQVKTVNSIDYVKRLTALDMVLDTLGKKITKLEGFADAPGPVTYNNGISERRAISVKAFVKNSIDSGTLIKGEGEPSSTVSQTTPARNDEDRRVDIYTTIENPEYYVYISEINVPANNSAPTLIPADPANVPDGPVHSGVIGGDAEFTHNGTTYTATQNDATSLAQEINQSQNAGFKAEAIGDVVHIMASDSEEFAEVEIFARDESTGFRHGETNFQFNGTKTIDTSKVSKKEKTVNRHATTGVSIGARYSRQFSVNMSGNLNVTAELTAVPPPNAFLEFIKSNNSYAGDD